MKIAVIGAGVSGLVAARSLTQHGHEVSVFEANDCWGGHAQSLSLESEGVSQPIETGFLVFNEAACPRLTNLLAELYVPTREVRMAYEIRDGDSKLVIRGESLRELLGVNKNLTVPSFYRLVPDWIRFTRAARRQVRSLTKPSTTTLAEFLKANAFSKAFVEQFVYPLAGAVFPMERNALPEMPLANLLGFIHNHGLLKLTRGTSCRTLVGGSSEYLLRLTDSYRDRIHLNCPVASVARHPDYVLLKFRDRPRERFEQVVLAVHADIALRLLADPMRHEREVLESFEYADQNVYIHADDALQRPNSAAATWRFNTSSHAVGESTLSYRIDEVQDVDTPTPLVLTMANGQQLPPDNLLRTIRFRRPVFSTKAIVAQRRFRQLNSWRRTCFCGAYWGHGFHEDAVRTAEAVAERITQFNEHAMAISR